MSLNYIFHVGNAEIITGLMGFFEELVYNIHLLWMFSATSVLCWVTLHKTLIEVFISISIFFISTVVFFFKTA